MSSDEIQKILSEIRPRSPIIQSRHQEMATIKLDSWDGPVFVPGQMELKDIRLTVGEPSIDPLSVHKGECYCGKVKLEISRSATPPFCVYCHCGDCRIAHASNVYSVFYWFPFTIPTPIVCVGGADLINYYQKSWIIRAFCKECGTRLFNASTHNLGSFPSIFNTLPFIPKAHWNYKECRNEQGARLPFLEDHLIKFLDRPCEFGGSGIVLDDEHYKLLIN